MLLEKDKTIEKQVAILRNDYELVLKNSVKNFSNQVFKNIINKGR